MNLSLDVEFVSNYNCDKYITSLARCQPKRVSPTDGSRHLLMTRIGLREQSVSRGEEVEKEIKF